MRNGLQVNTLLLYQIKVLINATFHRSKRTFGINDSDRNELLRCYNQVNSIKLISYNQLWQNFDYAIPRKGNCISRGTTFRSAKQGTNYTTYHLDAIWTCSVPARVDGSGRNEPVKN